MKKERFKEDEREDYRARFESEVNASVERELSNWAEGNL